MALISREVGLFKAAEEVQLLEEMGLGISFALDSIENEAERKLGENKLRESEASLKELQRIAHLGNFAFDFVNGSWESSDVLDEMLGIDPSYERSIAGWLSLVHPDDRSMMPDYVIDKGIGRDQTFNREYRIIRQSDQALRWLWSRASLEWDIDGGLLNMRGISLDITERKQVEEQMARLLERFDLASRAAQLGVWDWNIVNDHLVWDERMYHLYGVKKEDFSRAYEAWVKGLHPDDRFNSEEILQQALRGEKEYINEFRVVWPDGSIHWLKTHGQVIRDANGIPQRMIGVNYEITDQKSAVVIMRQQADRLKLLADASLAYGAVSQDYQTVLDQVVHQVVDILADMCQIRLLSDDGDLLELAAIYSLNPEHSESLRTLAHLASERTGDPGLVPHVFRTGEPAFVPVVTEAQLRASIPAENWLTIGPYLPHSYIIVPLRVHGRSIGVMSLTRYRTEQPAFTLDDLNLAQDLASRAALAINNARLFDQVQKELVERKRAEAMIENQLRHLSALQTIDMAITSSLDLRVTLNVLLEHVLAQLDVDASIVLLLNHSLNELEYAAGRGFHGSSITRLRLKVGEDYAGKAALERSTICIPNLSQADHSFTRAELSTEERFVSFCAVPLIAKGQVNGVLEVFQRTRLDPDPEWLDYLETLAGQAAIAIDSAQLYDELHQSNIELALAYDATIEGWSRAMDLRDRETEGHTLRVTELTMHLARAAGMTSEQIAHVRRGALLHDMGKLGVPDSILFKPGKLSDEERALMRKHPQYAYDMLSSIEYLRPALEIPYCHHEKWDGTGYPRGLKRRADSDRGALIRDRRCVGCSPIGSSLSRKLV